MPSTLYWISTSSTDWDTVGNWSTGSKPATGDTVYITNNAVSIDTGLAQSGVTLAALHIDQSYTGRIGSASAYLAINATTLSLGQDVVDGATTGSGRIKLDGTFTTANVFNTAVNSSDTGLPPVRLKGTITTLNVLRGKVGVAVSNPTETTTITTFNCSKDPSATQPVVTLGYGVTVGTINNKGGKIVNRTNNEVTLLTQQSGDYVYQGTGAHETVNINNGSVRYDGTGTVTLLNVYAGSVDFSYDTRSKTVSWCNVFGPCSILFNTGVAGSVTFTDGIDLNGVPMSAVRLDCGADRKVSFGALTSLPS